MRHEFENRGNRGGVLNFSAPGFRITDADDLSTVRKSAKDSSGAISSGAIGAIRGLPPC